MRTDTELRRACRSMIDGLASKGRDLFILERYAALLREEGCEFTPRRSINEQDLIATGYQSR